MAGRTVPATFHWDGYGQDHKSQGHVAKVPGVMHGFHTFGLWWKSDEYIFYVDGKETWRTRRAASAKCRSTCCSATKSATGQATSPRRNSDQFLVDYVRVYDLVEKK